MKYAQFIERHMQVVTRSGDEWSCICPFHRDTAPSLSVNVRSGLWVCYACGAKGSARSLATRFDAEVESLGTRSIDDVKAKVATVGKPVANATISLDVVEHWKSSLQKEGGWSARGISTDVIEEFDLGFDDLEDALTIPIHHPMSGRPVSVIKRLLQPEPGSPKYRYARGFRVSDHLYGAWHVQRQAPLAVAVTEGSIDALSMWSVGIPAVALLGARVSRAQGSLLRSLDVRTLVVMTDNDEAGRRAAEALESIQGSGVRCHRPSWWPSKVKDPGEMSDADKVGVFDSALSQRRSAV